MTGLEQRVIEVSQGLLTGTEWKAPAGGTIAFSYYAGSLPERGADTADFLGEEPPAAEYENPFILVRQAGLSFTEPQDGVTVYIWAQLFDDDRTGRDELNRLALLLRPLINYADYGEWAVEDNMDVQLGDQYGNQADPVFIALFTLKFYKGS